MHRTGVEAAALHHAGVDAWEGQAQREQCTQAMDQAISVYLQHVSPILERPSDLRRMPVGTAVLGRQVLVKTTLGQEQVWAPAGAGRTLTDEEVLDEAQGSVRLIHHPIWNDDNTKERP